MMALADVALYAAVLARVGLEPLAVTTNLAIHFLRKPRGRCARAGALPLRSSSGAGWRWAVWVYPRGRG